MAWFPETREDEPMKSSVISVLLGCSLAAGGALADRGGHNRFLEFFDANGDGSVTRAEFDTAAAERFARMDANSDGKMTREEFRAYVKDRRSEHRAGKFRKIDANGDGKISKEEFTAHKMQRIEQRFARLDEDKDGAISQDEFANGRHYGRKCGQQGHKRGAFRRMDRDGDGVVTREESYQAWSGWFDRIDANHDKVVTRKEIEDYRAERHRQWKERQQAD